VVREILVVEDDAVIAMNMEWVLSQGGWQVIGPVATASAALRLLRQHHPDVAVLDVKLEDGFVTPVAEELRTLGIPFVLASAHERPERVAGAVLAGAANAGKPTDFDLLLHMLDDAVEHSARERAH
jgi:two-component system, response regulator PdtaR